ncbi:restriction endonuclease subunit S [Corynebacterium cystitidis]|uniref:restriction endonuclease subunit S n=1 Tax=Corynebacterium cystitidis TaxID=35757 RepID=UPI00211EDDFD|nr:restriction endonuclease subunit S [Corynebacterium cystitidis]
MRASLNQQLAEVEWGEFSIGELFDVVSSKKRFDANKIKLTHDGYPYVVRTSVDNGHRGKINEDPAFLNPGNTISFGQDTATIFYQEFPYFTGDKIKVLIPKDVRFGRKNAQFIIAAMYKAFSSFSWGASRFNVETLRQQRVLLPAKDASVNYNFIEKIVAELEAERLAELEAYLKATGLADTQLTDAEGGALAALDNVEWVEVPVIDIFKVRNTGNILARNIKPGSGTVPYVTAMAENNSVSTYADPACHRIEEGNCIFIGGKTFVVSYQPVDFLSNDSHNLVLYPESALRTKLAQLFLATSVFVGMKHQYNWGNSVSNAKIQNDRIKVPYRDGEPDLKFMEELISAVQKLVIKDVVSYADRRLNATKDAIDCR